MQYIRGLFWAERWARAQNNFLKQQREAQPDALPLLSGRITVMNLNLYGAADWIELSVQIPLNIVSNRINHEQKFILVYLLYGINQAIYLVMSFFKYKDLEILVILMNKQSHVIRFTLPIVNRGYGVCSWTWIGSKTIPREAIWKCIVTSSLQVHMRHTELILGTMTFDSL